MGCTRHVLTQLITFSLVADLGISIASTLGPTAVACNIDSTSSTGCTPGCHLYRYACGSACDPVACCPDCSYGYYSSTTSICPLCCPNPGRCRFGTYSDTRGCPVCCLYLGGCAGDMCVDANGCRECCPIVRGSPAINR